MFHVKQVFACLALFFALAKPSSAQKIYSTVRLQDKPVKLSTKVDSALLAFNQSQPGYDKLNPQEKEWYYWTNWSRKNPKAFWDEVAEPILMVHTSLLSGPYAKSMKDDLYKAEPLPYLRLNDTLLHTSLGHALDVGIKEAEFSHHGTDGRSFQQRFKEAGLHNFGGENISLGSGNVPLSLTLLYLDFGLERPGHRITLLNSDYTDIGIGVSDYGASGSKFMVQDFSSPQKQLGFVSRGTISTDQGIK
jgi:hypothetical protein